MQKVNVALYSKFPEILSDIKGNIAFDFSDCPTNHKAYTFYSCTRCVGVLQPDDAVICQVNNTMTVGRVIEVLDMTTQEAFLRASLARNKKVKNGYRLVLSKIHIEDLSMQQDFKHKYEAAVREVENTSNINEVAFKLALDRL